MLSGIEIFIYFFLLLFLNTLTLNRPGFLESSTAGGGGADSAPLCNFLI